MTSSIRIVGRNVPAFRSSIIVCGQDLLVLYALKTRALKFVIETFCHLHYFHLLICSVFCDNLRTFVAISSPILNFLTGFQYIALLRKVEKPDVINGSNIKQIYLILFEIYSLLIFILALST